MDRYQGRIVHPQTWPERPRLRRASRCVVIGSGRHGGDARSRPSPPTASTSPCCSGRRPSSSRGRNVNEVADMLRELDIPEEWTHEIVRRKILQDQAEITQHVVRVPRAGPRRTAPTASPRSSPRATTSRRTSPPLPAVAAAARLRARRRPVQGHQQRQGVGRDRRDRDLHRDRHPARRPASSSTPISSSPPPASTCSVLGDIAFTVDGRPRQLRRHRHLPRDDVHRRPEPAVGVRVLPGELDAARRPHRRLRLPAAAAHGRPRRATG